jgi:NTE family protein
MTPPEAAFARGGPDDPSGRSFALVLAGGGARGFAHVGVLKTLESMGLRPAGIVGVSMGSVVAATYGLRGDWYDALLELDTHGAPSPEEAHELREEPEPAVRRAWMEARAAWSLLTGWGAPEEAVNAARASLEDLIGTSRLEDCRIPVTVCATDLMSGRRAAFSTGPALPALLASSSLAGILPPVELGDRLLVDGVYADIAPVDLARAMGVSAVIAVDPRQRHTVEPPTNGLQVVMRAMEICHRRHADERLATADLVLRPDFPRYVDVLDFGARGLCIEAGCAAVEADRARIVALLTDEGAS